LQRVAPAHRPSYLAIKAPPSPPHPGASLPSLPFLPFLPFGRQPVRLARGPAHSTGNKRQEPRPHAIALPVASCHACASSWDRLGGDRPEQATIPKLPSAVFPSRTSLQFGVQRAWPPAEVSRPEASGGWPVASGHPFARKSAPPSGFLMKQNACGITEPRHHDGDEAVSVLPLPLPVGI
jgi:hypothetical protein